jgi:hypothetical protein
MGNNITFFTLNYNGFEYAPWYNVFLEQWVFKELDACFIKEAHHSSRGVLPTVARRCV